MPTYSAAAVSTACSSELPERIISGWPFVSPISSSPAATDSMRRWNSAQVKVRQLSAPLRWLNAGWSPRVAAQRGTKPLKPSSATRMGASTARISSDPSARHSCAIVGRTTPASRYGGSAATAGESGAVECRLRTVESPGLVCRQACRHPVRRPPTRNGESGVFPATFMPCRVTSCGR
ncbi:hypothetical protein D3C85_1109090 [compost metagenome]